jgi:hypothetical protein
MIKKFSTGLTAAAVMAFGLVLVGGTAVSVADEDGGQASAYMDWGIGARAVAMGSAYSAIADGPTGFWWNPAGVAQVRQGELEMSMRKMSFDRQAGYLAFVHPVGREEAAVALSWVYAGVGDLFARDLSGNRGDLLSDYTNAAAFTFGRRFTPEHSQMALSLGLSLRYIQHNIAGISAYSVGFDFGAHMRYQLRRRYVTEGDRPPELLVGIAVQRLNLKYPWSTGDYWIPEGEDGGSSFDEEFPFLIRGGVGTRLMNGQLTTAFDLSADEKLGLGWHLGVEGLFREVLALRGGVDDGDPTFGAGFEPTLTGSLKLAISYAFAIQPDAIDAEHIFSFGIRF